MYWKRIAFGAGVVCLLGYLVRMELHAALANLREVREWDFLCFWLWGKAGARGVNFYDPAAIAWTARGLELSPEFRRQIVDVGFWYPPPTMLLFAPFGALPLRAGLLLWYALQCFWLAMSAVLLRRIVGTSRWPTTAILGTILLSLPTAHMTLWLGQTNFMALTMLALLWFDRDRARAGLWLGLGMVIKPYFALLAGFLLIRRNWRALGVGLAACIVLALATGLIFGWEPILTFIHDSPLARLPTEVHSELVNQSLYGTILRLTHSELEAHSARVNMGFVLVALAFMWPTVLLASRSWREAPDLSYSLILTCGLLVYPSTLAHYAICLIVPLLLLWRRQESRSGEHVVVAFMALVGLVTGIAHGHYAFWAIAATWFAFVLQALASETSNAGAPLPSADGTAP